MKNNVVCKFGGTSLADSQNISKVKDIILKNSRRFVIVSAPGKRNKEDIKITDILIKSFEMSKKGEDFSQIFDLFKQRIENIKNDFKITDLDLTSFYQDLIKEIKEHKNYDYVISRGEFFSALLISKILKYQFLDSSKFIFFDQNGFVNLALTKQKFLSLINKNGKYVIPGFYGVGTNEKIKVFSRGGSDVTGAIVASIVGAETYENWTDVDGFLVADPRLCKNPELISELNYHELRELSYMGANVLHPDCVRFLRENNVVLNLRNTFNPTCKGSLIMPDSKKINHKKLTGIAGQKGFTIIHIEKFSINESLGIIEKIANIFKKYNISIEHIPTGIDSVSVITKGIFINDSNKNSLISELKAQILPDNIDVIENVALISVVGTKLKNDKNLEGEIFKSIFNSKANLITLNKGAGGISIIFGVKESEFEKTIKTLYNDLF